jgi:hypothetical protein
MATVKLTDRAVLAAKPDNGKRLEIWDTATPGLCLRVGENGKKVFVYRYRTEDGRQPRVTLGAYSSAFGLADARAAAARLRVDVHAGKDPAGERRQRIAKARAQPLKTFNDLADAYFAACESGYWRPRNKKKKAKTIQDERKLLNRHIKRPFGALRIEDITKTVVRDLLRNMLDRGIRVQTNRTHALIRQAFSYAVSEERGPHQSRLRHQAHGGREAPRSRSQRHGAEGPFGGSGVASRSPEACPQRQRQDRADLRRTGATNMVSERLRFAPFIVSQVLGHSSDTGGAAAVTLAHYALYNYASEKRGALEAWEALLLEIVGDRRRPTRVRQPMPPPVTSRPPRRPLHAVLALPRQNPDFRAQVLRGTDSLLEEHGQTNSPLDLADWIQQELDDDGGARLDPTEPELWRAIAIELRRRSIRAV